MRQLVLVVPLVAVALTGCAIGNRYAYQSVVASPQLSGTAAVSVATHDQREYVRSGSKDPQFVGLQRGGFGNPFDVRTADDKPFADAVTTALVNTLTKKGFRAQPVSVAHSVTPDAARQQAMRVGADRALVLTLQEWKSDAALRVGLTYDMTMTVLDRTGTVLAEKRLQGHDNLGAASLPSQVGEVVAAAFKTKLEQLLDDSDVAWALRGAFSEGRAGRRARGPSRRP
jgi:hypothetical protein